MKIKSANFRYRRDEQGQTLALVALSIVALLGFAALAIDVATLYVAHSEVQRAADAAALAGAKVIADSGVTSFQTGDPNYATLQSAAELAATTEIAQLIASRNQVAGGTASLVGSPIYSFPQPNDPQVTVTVQRTSLPVFFAKIWGQRPVTSSATAIAEAYSPTGASDYSPIAPRCVKPLLILNLDNTGQPLVSGGVVRAADLPATSVNVVSDCKNVGPPPFTCQLASLYPSYLVGQVTANPNNVCPTSCGGVTQFEQSIQCCDANAYQCGVGAASWDDSINPTQLPGSNELATAGQCLIHATGSGLGLGQDTLLAPPPAVPIQIETATGPHPGTFVTTSQSIVTMPIITPPPNPGSGPVDVVGFMQAFINTVGTNGTINLTVLNIAACGTVNASVPSPIVGGSGTSPVAVRLISPP